MIFGRKQFNMKTLILFTAIYLSVFIAFGQVDEPYMSIYKDIDAVRKTTNQQDSKMIISNWAFNRLMASKLSYYISSVNDISLFKNYAVVSVEDKELSFGHNFYFTKDETFFAKEKNISKDDFKLESEQEVIKDLGNIRSFLTIGATTTIDKGFATLFKDNDFANELSLNVRFTVPFKMLIDFDGADGTIGNQKQLMNNKRVQHIEGGDLKNELKKEYDKFLASVKGTSTEFIEEKKKKFLQELDEKTKIAYADFEVKNVEYNYVRMFWLSIIGNFSVPQKTYSFQKTISFTEESNKEKFSNFDFALQINKVKETGGNHSSFTSLKVSAQNYNSVLAATNKETSLNYYDIIQSSPNTTVQVLNEDKSKKFYTGNFRKFLIPQIRLQKVWSPNIKQLKDKGLSIGIGGFIEQSVGEFQATDIGGNLIFGLRGRKEDQPVNFIIQVKSNNFKGQFDGNKKTVAGISVAFPFGSKIY